MESKLLLNNIVRRYLKYKKMETGTIILVVWFIGIIGFTYMMVKMGNTIGDNNEADWDLDENELK